MLEIDAKPTDRTAAPQALAQSDPRPARACGHEIDAAGELSAHSEDAAPRPAAPVIDVAHLTRMTLGEKSLEGEVLHLFARQASLLSARMMRAAPDATASFAHTLKGSARGIGAWQVAIAAEVVERATIATDPAELADALDRLAVAVDEARSMIMELLTPRS